MIAISSKAGQMCRQASEPVHLAQKRFYGHQLRKFKGLNFKDGRNERQKLMQIRAEKQHSAKRVWYNSNVNGDEANTD